MDLSQKSNPIIWI